MHEGRRVIACAAVWALAAPLYAQDPAALPAQPPSIVREIRLVGARELSQTEAIDAAGVRVGEPLPSDVEVLANRVEERYRSNGYSFARVTAQFVEASGELTITVDEGVIDGVEFTGVDESLASTLAHDFAVRAGDVFNRDRALEALEALLRPTRGALRPGRGRPAADFTDSRRLSPRREIFDLVGVSGQRVLRVALRKPAGTFRVVTDLGEREDWFTPVDGFVPSLGFGAAVFDHRRFNHAYIAGHLSFKTAPHRAGYAFGLERPLFGTPTLYVGAELHDLTATDDSWQVSSFEASLAALAVRKSFRDYYRRRGGQVHAALRVHPRVELLFAWRGERHAPLAVASDFSLWNRADEFRPNAAATDGRLNALVVGASLDAVGFNLESIASTYRRHQLEMPFGERLNAPEGNRARAVWRLDWASEVSSPDALNSDFDFARHIVGGRLRAPLSSHEELRARAIGGWSSGTLPPQRLFSIGGIGSVHGYKFKEALGDDLALVNVEYAIGRLGGPHAIAFFDAGRIGSRAANASVWLKGTGFGLGLGRDLRVDFGYKLDDIPGSLQVLLRFGRTF